MGEHFRDRAIERERFKFDRLARPFCPFITKRSFPADEIPDRDDVNIETLPAGICTHK